MTSDADRQRAYRKRRDAKLARADALAKALSQIERLASDRLDPFGKRIHEIARAAKKGTDNG